MKKQIYQYIKTWESRCYNDGIPDDAPEEIFEKVPSYRKIAIAILKNDLQVIGFTPKKSVYYDMLKKIELQARENSKLSKEVQSGL